MVDPEVAQHGEEMLKRGANQQGEGGSHKRSRSSAILRGALKCRCRDGAGRRKMGRGFVRSCRVFD